MNSSIQNYNLIPSFEIIETIVKACRDLNNYMEEEDWYSGLPYIREIIDSFDNTKALESLFEEKLKLTKHVIKIQKHLLKITREVLLDYIKNRKICERYEKKKMEIVVWFDLLPDVIGKGEITKVVKDRIVFIVPNKLNELYKTLLSLSSYFDRFNCISNNLHQTKERKLLFNQVINILSCDVEDFDFFLCFYKMMKLCFIIDEELDEKYSTFEFWKENFDKRFNMINNTSESLKLYSKSLKKTKTTWLNCLLEHNTLNESHQEIAKEFSKESKEFYDNRNNIKTTDMKQEIIKKKRQNDKEIKQEKEGKKRLCNSTQ